MTRPLRSIPLARPASRWAWVRDVDWPLVLQRGGSMLRAIRGDGQRIAQDAADDTDRIARLRSTIDQVARKAIGCSAPASCRCAICLEGSQ